MTTDPVDLDLNDDLNVHISARGDLVMATGRDAFEQELMLRVSDRYLDIVGVQDKPTIRGLLEIEAERVADEMEMLEGVSDFRIQFSDVKPNTVIIRVIYDTGEIFEFSEEG